ncbi:MAG: hypothetical protein ACOZAM_03790 [Pseudomonadota bacterium]
MRILSIAAIAAALAVGPAMAASPMGQLKDVAGKVYVNRGTGFILAEGPLELYAGDRVMVGEDGSASIGYYLAGCDVALAATSLTTVSPAAPCQTAAQLPAQGAGSGPDTTLLIAGGVGVAAAIGGVVALTANGSDDDNDNGVSP